MHLLIEIVGTIFFETAGEKGQEPILILSIHKPHSISSDQLEILVSLFGHSPRYCFTRFVSKNTGITATEIQEESIALGKAESPAGKTGQRAKNADETKSDESDTEDNERAKISRKVKTLNVEVCSSSLFLEDALNRFGNQDPELVKSIKQATEVTRGTIIMNGVVKELEDICDSPSYPTPTSIVSTRLLTWGVPNDSFRASSDSRLYASYASPYIAKLVLETSSMQALRSIARFF